MLEAIVCLVVGLLLGLLVTRKKTPAPVQSAVTPNDAQTVAVLVVRSDLKMGKGKIAAQCCHAAIGLWTETKESSLTQSWAGSDYPHQIYKVTSEEQLVALGQQAQAAKLPWYLVADAGRTQIDPGSKTVLGIGPCARSALAPLTSSLRPF